MKNLHFRETEVANSLNHVFSNLDKILEIWKRYVE